ncbi:MAG: hypothetical protein M3445_10445, partial [Actinomycetota bacterium]|nr:hypothetical protein [Actinomycetota bacterium]
EYPWHGVLLVDTPGVDADHDDLHDEHAERAVRDADLILFVLTGSFFDDVTVRHFRHVLLDLDKLTATLVVINKLGQREVSDQICQDAIARGLGRDHVTLPPIVRCDGRDYLRATGDGDGDPEEVDASGVPRVIGALDELTRTAGPAGRLAKPFEAVLATAADAAPFLAVSDEERSLEELLERRRTVLAESRIRLDAGLERELLDVHRRIVSAGEAVIVSLSDGVPDSGAVQAFDDRVRSTAETLPDRVRREFEREEARLDAEERALAAAPEVQFLVQHESRFEAPIGPSRGSGLQDVLSVLTGPGRSWLDGVVTAGGRPGSPMHTAVKEVGHAVKHKFKPHGIVKVAKRVNLAITIATSVYEVYTAFRAQGELERQDAAAVADLRRRVVEAADALIDEARLQTAAHVSAFYAQLGAADEALTTQLRRAQAERDVVHDALDDVERRARAGLLLLRQGPGR